MSFLAFQYSRIQVKGQLAWLYALIVQEWYAYGIQTKPAVLSPVYLEYMKIKEGHTKCHFYIG